MPKSPQVAESFPEVIDCAECGAPGIGVIFSGGEHRVRFHKRYDGPVRAGVVSRPVDVACVGSYSAVAPLVRP